jgi:hypothetical protein
MQKGGEDGQWIQFLCCVDGFSHCVAMSTVFVSG